LALVERDLVSLLEVNSGGRLHPAVVIDGGPGVSHVELPSSVDEEALRVAYAPGARRAAYDPHLVPVGPARGGQDVIAAVEVPIPEEQPFHLRLIPVAVAGLSDRGQIIFVYHLVGLEVEAPHAAAP